MCDDYKIIITINSNDDKPLTVKQGVIIYLIFSIIAMSLLYLINTW